MNEGCCKAQQPLFLFLFFGSVLTLAIGEAPAQNFRDLADDHKTSGVDLTGQAFQLGNLVIGHNAEDHFRIQMTVTTLSVKYGHAPVHLGENGLTDFVGTAADDLYFCPAGAQKHHLVQGDGNDDQKQNAVERT